MNELSFVKPWLLAQMCVILCFLLGLAKYDSQKCMFSWILFIAFTEKGSTMREDGQFTRSIHFILPEII